MAFLALVRTDKRGPKFLEADLQRVRHLGIQVDQLLVAYFRRVFLEDLVHRVLRSVFLAGLELWPERNQVEMRVESAFLSEYTNHADEPSLVADADDFRLARFYDRGRRIGLARQAENHVERFEFLCQNLGVVL